MSAQHNPGLRSRTSMTSLHTTKTGLTARTPSRSRASSLAPAPEPASAPESRTRTCIHVIVTLLAIASVASFVFTVLIYTSTDYIPKNVVFAFSMAMFTCLAILSIFSCCLFLRTRLPAGPGNRKHGYETSDDDDGADLAEVGGFRGLLDTDTPTKIRVTANTIGKWLGRVKRCLGLWGPPACANMGKEPLRGELTQDTLYTQGDLQRNNAAVAEWRQSQGTLPMQNHDIRTRADSHFAQPSFQIKRKPLPAKSDPNLGARYRQDPTGLEEKVPKGWPQNQRFAVRCSLPQVVEVDSGEPSPSFPGGNHYESCPDMPKFTTVAWENHGDGGRKAGEM